ncbi:hypothetical protein AKJ61_02620 [candidate division MSBL1 archaeon SCGC-AAA259B11]|uniref:Transposase IS4-like domain-containing protein n=1 Tax=candidate division MSBL1 archaeon SCGC-AAA259B11 TaxID=1698260 RepID=A0A133U5Y3_9EURY|nr:hypothetical protein AKJ61_02620 [candidate division MSBL1 archaeon SCGC-AAA259B11]
MKAELVEKINEGDLDPAAELGLVVSFAEDLKGDILQRFHRNETDKMDKRFTEFILIEAVRMLLEIPPVTFYDYLRHNAELRNVMDLKCLKDLGNYMDFKRKRKKLDVRFKDVSIRNFDSKSDEVYALDNFKIEVDLNKYRSGKKIKQEKFDAEFQHSTTKGTIVGFQASLLINLSNFSLQKLDINSIETAKKDIWKEMVLENLGTKQGKKKSVIADGGFFAYDNYIRSVRRRVVPIINPRSGLEERVKEKLEEASVNIEWFDSQNSKQFKKLLEEFEEIVGEAVEKSLNYDDFKVERSKIEHIFKIAKEIFGMKDLHIYSKKTALWRAFAAVYVSTLFYQFLERNEINPHRAMGLLSHNKDAW